MATRRGLSASTTPLRRSREKAFRDLLLKISHNLSEDDVASLLFTGELERSSGAKPTPPIDALQRLHERGKFSPNSCANLHAMLAEINRHDLAQLVNRYMDTYPPQQLVECRQSDDSAGYDSLTSLCTAGAGENATVIQQERGFISGSHITVNRNSSEDDCSDASPARGHYHRAQPTERACKSMTRDFQSAGSLSIGSQIHWSQVTLEPGAEGLHSGFRSFNSSLHSQAPHININIKVNATESNPSSPPFSSLAPTRAVKRETANRDPETPQPFSPRDDLRSMHSSLHTAEATISEERPEEKREAGLGSPITTSGDSSIPKLSPMPEGESSIPVSSKRQTGKFM